MESTGGFGFNDANNGARKKRSTTSRRPRNESTLPSDHYRNFSSLSSTPPSDNNISKVSSNENNDNGLVSRRKEMSLNLCTSKVSYANVAEDGGLGESDDASFGGTFRGSYEQRNNHGVDSRRSSKGVLAPANWRGSSKVEHLGTVSDELENESRVNKVKLKVGGVVRTIHAKSTLDGLPSLGRSSANSSQSSDVSQPRRRLKLKGSSEENRSFSRSQLDIGKADFSRAKMPEGSGSIKQADQSESVRKSKRVPKRRLLHEALDNGEDDEDEEIRYLEKLKASKVNAEYIADYDDDERGSRKQQKISKVLKKTIGVGDYWSSKSRGEGKMSRSGRVYDDTDYVEEDELVSDAELDTKRKKLRKEVVDSTDDYKKEMTVTTRRRALQTGKDVPSSIGTSVIEYPNGLPPAPPRKQKEKLSELEQQLKKAEAAQRRRIQVEKANRESEAEAIRKILGQDSSRKKREDKIKKRQEDIAQEKAANAMSLGSDTVRWVMGPSGTVVTFPLEMGLPAIFQAKPCSYPPPREKCAGPACTNPYKYRDSKSNLPLCSLRCYRAIHDKILPLTAC